MILTLDDLTVDLVARTVYQNAERIQLPDLSFDVLVALLEASPEPVSTGQLVKEVWKTQHVSEDTISQRIKLLRRAIGDNGKSPRYIRTVRGVGYAVLGTVNKQTDSNSEPRERRSALPLSAALFACLIIVVVITNALQSDQSPDINGDPIKKPTAANEIVTRSHVDNIVQRARQQLSLHQPDETARAIDMLREVLEDVPEHFNARLVLSFALSTQSTKFGGGYDVEEEAESLARELITEAPTSASSWSALGYTLSSQGRSEEALAAYRQSYALDPSNAGALSSAAHILLLTGDFHQALILEAQSHREGVTAKYSEIQIAQILQLLGHPAAQHWLDKAHSLNPGQAVVLAEVARFYIRKNQPEAALNAINQYAEEDDSAPQIPQLKGRILTMLGHESDAKVSLAKAGWRGHALLAAIAAKDGDMSVFETYYPSDKLLLMVSETEPEMRVQLAEIYAAQGSMEKAYTTITEAINLGWRDVNWLEISPFLKELMGSNFGEAIRQRIQREVEAQHQLIMDTPELDVILSQRDTLDEKKTD